VRASASARSYSASKFTGAARIVVREVAHEKGTGLLDLHQEHGGFVLLGRDGHGQHDFAQLRRQDVHARVQIEVDLRVPLAIQARAIGRFVRAVLQVHGLQGQLAAGGVGITQHRRGGSGVAIVVSH
jgi:hypothetical protein